MSHYAPQTRRPLHSVCDNPPVPYFEGPRGRLHYRSWPIDNPTAALALLPGTGQHSTHYHRFARTLAPAGIELHTLDTSGHGLSEGDPDRPGTLPDLAADAHTFLTQIQTNPPKPLILMGHSLGAATALAVVAQSPTPFAGLVLCGTPKAVFDGEPTLPEGLPVLVVHGLDDRRAPIDRVREWARRAPVDFHEYVAGHDLLHEPVQTQVTADIADWIATLPTRR